jgi:citrate lyase subunit beta / citryl-CoA lyase
VVVPNEEFAPRRGNRASYGLLAVYDEPTAAGRGLVECEGKMIDVPVVARARELVAPHERIAQRERN